MSKAEQTIKVEFTGPETFIKSYDTSGYYALQPQWVFYQMHKIAVCASAGNTRNVFPAIEFKGKR